MGFWSKIFGNKVEGDLEKIESNNQEYQLIKQFKRLNEDDRLKKVMYYGDTADTKYYQLLKYCITKDESQSVQFAALKRIHLFKDHPDLVPMLKELGDTINISNLEPYYSMALSRVGLISIEDFKKRVGGK